MTAGSVKDLQRLLYEANTSSREAIAAANALLEAAPMVPHELQGWFDSVRVVVRLLSCSVRSQCIVTSLVCAGKEFSRKIDHFPPDAQVHAMRRRRGSSVLGGPAASRPLRAGREPALQSSCDERLKRTVVLSNVRESDHAERRVRTDADEEAVGKVLSTLGLQLAVNKTFRVGGVQNKDGSERTRPRSLFVEMQSVRAAKKVLHRKHLLGKTGEDDPNASLRGVYIDRPKESMLASKQAKCMRKARRRAMQLKNEMSTEELLEWLATIPPSEFRLPKDLPVTCDEGQLLHEVSLPKNM